MKKHYQHLKEEAPYWPNNSLYFLTESTFLHFPYFKNYDQKLIVLNRIKDIKRKLDVPVADYSIAQNHFHVKFYLRQGLLLSKVKQLLRGGISFDYRKKYKLPYKEMWQSRKSLIILSEDMNWKISGYIVGNLLKHKELSTFRDLENCEFSSYWYLANKYGGEKVRNLVRSVIVADEDSWGEIDVEKLDNIYIPKTSRLKSRERAEFSTGL